MLDSPATTPTGRREHPPWRVAAGLLLIADAGIHGYQVATADTAVLVIGFILSAAGLAAGAVLLVASAPRLGWVLGGLTSLLTFAGYLVARATKVPGDADDAGNRSEPLGVVPLVPEAPVAAARWGLSGPHRLRGRHLAEEARAVAPGPDQQPGPRSRPAPGSST